MVWFCFSLELKVTRVGEWKNAKQKSFQDLSHALDLLTLIIEKSNNINLYDKVKLSITIDFQPKNSMY